MSPDRDPFAGWVSARQAAERLGLSQSRISQLRREHVLKARSSPLGWLYSIAELDKLTAGRQEKTPA